MERWFLGAVTKPSVTNLDSWVNGRPEQMVSTGDRGLAYGDGVFETIRISALGPVLMDYHWQRLSVGVDRLGISLDLDQFRDELESYPGLKQPGVVKVIITRGSGLRGYQTNGTELPNRIISWSRISDSISSSKRAANSIRVFPCVTPLSTNPVLAGIKHLNRLEQVLAAREWANLNYQEGLMSDLSGHPIEGVSSNFFIVSNGTILTPIIDNAGVAGTMRRWLLDCFRGAGYTVAEQSVKRTQIESCDEWFFCNSVMGIRPVSDFANRLWPVGPITQWVQQQVWESWAI